MKLRLYDAQAEREAGPALPVPARRRLRVWRSRHARAVLRRDGAPDGHAGARGRLPAGARASLAGRESRIRSRRRAGRRRARRRWAGGDRAGALRRQRRRQFRDRRQPRAARRAAAVPVLAQWPIYPAADPGKRYPSKEDFGEGYVLTRTKHGLVRIMLLRRRVATGAMRRWSRARRGMPPTLVDDGEPRSDPRPGPGLCRGLRRGRGCATYFCRSRGDGPRLHQPAPGDPLGGRRHRAGLAALKQLSARRGDDPGPSP